MARVVLGGMTYTWLGSTGRSLVTSLTGIEVVLLKSCVSALACIGSRCCTRTNPIPVSSGRCFSNSVNASNPPADAPMPTMGKREGDGLCRGDRSREVALVTDRFATFADDFLTFDLAGTRFVAVAQDSAFPGI